MQEIRDMTDLTEFSGKIVSFESASSFSTPKECFSIGGKMFAYVGKYKPWYNQDRVFRLKFSILYHSQGDTVWHHLMTSSELKKISMKASSASPEEIDLIKQALINGQARFASSDSDLDNILETDAVPCRPWSKVRPADLGKPSQTGVFSEFNVSESGTDPHAQEQSSLPNESVGLKR